MLAFWLVLATEVELASSLGLLLLGATLASLLGLLMLGAKLVSLMGLLMLETKLVTLLVLLIAFESVLVMVGWKEMVE
jgi:hypothetical protein